MAKPIKGNRKLIEAGQRLRKLLQEVKRKNIQLSVDTHIVLESVRHSVMKKLLEHEKARMKQ